MKYVILFALFFVTSCTDTLDDSPKTRPVYFFSATLEKTGREVRVMVDSTDTRSMCMRVTYEVAQCINLPWLKFPYPDQVQAASPYYVVPLYGGCCGEFRFFVGNQRYSEVGLQADLSRQERITGQHIDIVIGGDGVRRMFNNDLSQLPIDKRMVVPYDWGTSRE